MLSIRCSCFHAKLTKTTPAVVNSGSEDRIKCDRGLKVVSQPFFCFSLPRTGHRRTYNSRSVGVFLPRLS